MSFCLFSLFLSFFSSNLLIPVRAPMCVWVSGHPLKHGVPTSDHVLQKQWFSLHQQLSAANSLSVSGGRCRLEIIYPSYDRILAGLISRMSCAGSHSCYAFMSAIALSCPEDMPPSLLHSFCPLFCDVPCTLVWGVDTSIAFRLEHSVYYFQALESLH